MGTSAVQGKVVAQFQLLLRMSRSYGVVVFRYFVIMVSRWRLFKNLDFWAMFFFIFSLQICITPTT